MVKDSHKIGTVPNWYCTRMIPFRNTESLKIDSRQVAKMFPLHFWASSELNQHSLEASFSLALEFPIPDRIALLLNDDKY